MSIGCPRVPRIDLGTPPRGLSEREAVERSTHGQSNSGSFPTSRSYRQIFIENVFTFINLCLVALGITLAALGRVGDALISTFVISLNVLVSVVQEIRAKRTLDRIALLARPTAIVRRDGRERTVAPDELVVGDVIKVGPGDQILVDGCLIVGAGLAVDESLLTGEADLVAKQPQDAVFSGTFCVTGSGYYAAERVGAASLAHQMTSSARAFRRVLTPLQRQINVVVRIALLIVLYMEFLLVVMSVLQQLSPADSVANSTIVAGLVPNGLFLSIAVAYALGAVRIARFGALVQQANAIESLSHVDVICLDKTGTLTANRLRVAGVYPIGTTETEIERALGTMAASAGSGNKTTEALHVAWPTPAYPLAGEIPFSSGRKWSAVAFAGGKGAAPVAPGVYVLGAPELLLPSLDREDSVVDGMVPLMNSAITAEIHSLASQGLRVLLLAHAPLLGALEDHGDVTKLPAGMRPLGLVALGDELRPEAREALRELFQAGVQPKIMSGDHPETVAAVARQAGVVSTAAAVSGVELERMNEEELAATAESANVFGRVTPQQKERLVRALHRRGHYVAMIGDGVNDVLSLKQADMGIAMHSGSQAARSVADVVLMQDSFAVLVPAVVEGQRIVNGMQDILKLFLTRISTVGLVIVSSLVVGAFPLELRQGSLVTFFSVGVPAIVLAFWAQPGPAPTERLMRRLLHFIVPPVVLSTAIGVALFVSTYALRLAQVGTFGARNAAQLANSPVAQTMLTAFLVYCGLFLVIFVEPPTPWWTGGSTLSVDRRPAMLAVAMMVVFAVMDFVPLIRRVFMLAPLGPIDYLMLGLALILWVVTLRAVWRSRLLSRYLSIDLN